MRISACVIAKDEADRIGPCLDSVAFCDEVLVLDSGSRDDTVRICREKGARVIETDWPGWVAQKNRAVREARHEWILSLDADERVDEALRASIEALRRAPGEGPDAPVAYEVTRLNRYLGRWIRHGGWYPQWRIRLFDRRRARWGGIDPHDRVEARGRVERLAEGNLLHRPYRSLADHVRQIDRFTGVAAEEMLSRGRRPGLWGLCARPPFHAFRMYVVRRGFLDGWPGFIAAGMYGWYVFLKYAKAWERGRRTGRTDRRRALREGVAPAFLDAAIRRHDEALRRNDDAVLKRGPRSAVTRHGDVVVKETLPATGLRRWKDRLAPGRHAAGYAGALRLEAAGVATARPLAWVREGPRSWTLYEDLSSLPRLDHHARALYRSGDRPGRRALRDAAAEWLGRLHKDGIYHGDLKAVNVLVRTEPERGFPLVDTDRVRFFARPVDRRRRVKNLAQLSASIPVCVSLSERLRFLRRYARAGGFDDEERAFAAAIHAEVSKKIVVVDEPIE
jgi:glycosyltransferase involved in cell wall biosynthesis